MVKRVQALCFLAFVACVAAVRMSMPGPDDKHMQKQAPEEYTVVIETTKGPVGTVLP